jgi:hypothetical protein
MPHALPSVTTVLKRASAMFYGPLLAVALAACGSSVATNTFTGEEHEVARAISNLQADASAGNQQKLCADDLASPVVRTLNRATGGCKQAIKNQIAEIDSFEVSIHAVHLAPGAHPTATATVKSINAGKTRTNTVTLVKEAGRWRVSGLQ